MLLDQQVIAPARFRTSPFARLQALKLETKSAFRSTDAKAPGALGTAPKGPHPMRARRTTADRLREALLKLSGQCATCAKHEETAWSSITFAGTRHEVTLVFEGAEAVAHGEELIEILPEHEFTIPGQLVADASVREVDHRFGMHERLEVTAVLLLLEES